MAVLGRSMTIKWSKFMGGYAQIVLSADDANGHNLSSLSPRFLRVCVTGGGTDGGIGMNRHIRLPAANELPLIPGAPIFTIWNIGYFNLDIRSHGGTLVGCLEGNHTGTRGKRASVFLLSTATEDGSWEMADSGDDCDTNTHSATGTVTISPTGTSTGTMGSGTGTWSGITDSSSITETDSTGYTFTQTLGGRAAPLPFPHHPEIPLPVPLPAAIMEEGI